MHPFEFVLIIIAMSFGVAILIKRMELRAKSPPDAIRSSAEHQENAKLREEVKDLKERLHVLERITTDKENSLAREIDSLRDR